MRFTLITDNYPVRRCVVHMISFSFDHDMICSYLHISSSIYPYETLVGNKLEDNKHAEWYIKYYSIRSANW